MEQKTNKNLSTSSKYARGAGTAYEGHGTQQGAAYKGLAAMAAELITGFWFGIGAILAIKMVDSLEELISRK